MLDIFKRIKNKIKQMNKTLFKMTILKLKI